MNDHELRLSRRESERLLDDPAAHDSALGWALSAANAPAHRGELRREDATVAAFHAARLSPPPATRSNYVSPSALGRRAAARAVVATGAIVALTSGGFALASSVDLPTLPGQASDRASESVARAPQPRRTTSTSSTTASEDPSESAEAGTSDDAETSGATPTPSFKGLCKAYQNGNRQTRGKSLDSAAFTALATEAGGKESIATYCVTVIGEPKAKPSKPAKPTQAATPSKPAKPTKPTRAVTATKPTPLKPTRPTRPEPVKPTQATTPVKPTATPTTATTSAQDAKDTKDAKGKPAGAGRP